MRTIRHGIQDRPILEEEKLQTQSMDMTMVFLTGTPPREFHLMQSQGSNDSRPHVVEPPRERSFIWQIGVNLSIQHRRQVDRGFYGVESTLTHYSTEPLPTGPDYDPLLLLLALAGDVHPNPGLSSYHCSVSFKNITSQGTRYLCT